MDVQRVVNLEDAETGLIYTTSLSVSDAQKVRTDMVYASQILDSLKKSQGNLHPSDSTVSVASTSGAETFSSEQYNIEDSAFKWSHQAILLLIEEYRKREEDITSGKISQKRVWESISRVLCNHQYNLTGPQCQSKFNGMKKTFKSIKDHNSKSGNAPRSWPYIEVMESLLGEKPFMNPVALASSTGQIMSENACTIISANNNETSLNFHSSTSHKKKSSDIAEAIIKSRRIAEENKLKRHQETMDQRDKLLHALDKLINKL